MAEAGNATEGVGREAEVEEEEGYDPYSAGEVVGAFSFVDIPLPLGGQAMRALEEGLVFAQKGSSRSFRSNDLDSKVLDFAGSDCKSRTRLLPSLGSTWMDFVPVCGESSHAAAVTLQLAIITGH